MKNIVDCANPKIYLIIGYYINAIIKNEYFFIEPYLHQIITLLLTLILIDPQNENFVDIMDYKFTAKMEASLDDIAEDKQDSIKFLNDFWKPFSATLENASKNMRRVDVESDKVCPNCGKPMVVKLSRYGKQFMACSGYPECKTALPMEGSAPVEVPADEPTDKKCEKCGSDMVIKTGPYGKYYQCLDEK